MANLTAVTTETFQHEVLDSKTPVLVDFWAEWCGPCRMVAPVVEDIAKQYAGTLKVVKLDIDEHGIVANNYGIQSIPTLMLFKDGKPAERIVGYMPKERLLTKIRPHIPAAV
jgi:thioredoxin 1